MKKLLFFLSITLPFLLNGQGLILQKSLEYSSFQMSKINKIASIFGQSAESCLIKTNDSISFVISEEDGLGYDKLLVGNENKDYYLTITRY